MQKLPSCVLALGFAILIGAAVVGWIIVPKVINNKIAEVSLMPYIFFYFILL